MIFIVTGMHRSGTSMITGLIEMLGIKTGINEDGQLAAEDNPKGFWERVDVREINDAILEAAGGSWWALSQFDLNSIDPVVKKHLIQQIQSILDECSDDEDWVLKDPRFSLTLPLWAECLSRYVCVIPTRHPLSCAVSLRSRNGFPLSFGLSVWEHYMVSLLQQSSASFITVEYGNMIHNPREVMERFIQKLQPFAQSDLAIRDEEKFLSFVDTGLNRSRSIWEKEEWMIDSNLEHLRHLVESIGDNIPPKSSIQVSDRAHSEMVSFEKNRKEYEQKLRQRDSEIEHLVAWAKSLETTVKERDEQVLEFRDTLNDKKKSVEKLKVLLQEKDNELQAKEDELSVVTNREETLAAHETIKQLKKDLQQKHDEMMKISDWAHSLNLKLKEKHQTESLSVSQRIRKFLRKQNRMRRERGWKNYFRAKTEIFERKYFPHRFSNRIAKVKFSELMHSIRKNNHRTIIVFSVIDWTFRWQRPQQILSRIAKKGYTVVYISVKINATRNDRTDRLKTVDYMSATDRGGDVFELNLSSQNPINVYLDSLKDRDIQIMEAGLEMVLQMMNPSELVYLVHLPTWFPLIEKIRSKFPGKLVFDCMDDHSGFDTSTDRLIKQENELIRSSDTIVVSSKKLETHIEKQNRDFETIRNACEFDHFRQTEKCEELRKFEGRKIIGYYGAIASWYDSRLVAAAAKQYPHCEFVLIGNHTGCDIDDFEDCPNIHLLGEIPYDVLPSYYSWFNVCLIPFKIIPLIEATNPVKFYEYLSQGKPVVSTALPELKPFSEICYLCENKDQFIASIGIALEEQNEEIVERRMQVALQNSWKKRGDLFLELIEGE